MEAMTEMNKRTVLWINKKAQFLNFNTEKSGFYLMYSKFCF